MDWQAGKCAEEAGATGPQDMLLSSGDSTGLGWHADFVAGWNERLLDRVLNSGSDACTLNLSTCPGINSTDPKDGAGIPNGPMIGMKFCSPLVASPNGERCPGGAVGIAATEVLCQGVSVLVCWNDDARLGASPSISRALRRADVSRAPAPQHCCSWRCCSRTFAPKACALACSVP